MKLPISDKVFVKYIPTHNHFTIYEDNVFLCVSSQYTILFDALSMVELLFNFYEVQKCLRKTTVRSTYVMLHEEKVRLEAEIERRTNIHNKVSV